MTTIKFNGKLYDAETVKGYYDMEITNYDDLGAKTEQEFFDRYIELDPAFTELFKYDIKPLTRKHIIVKDTTGEYIAIVQTEDDIFCKNTTKWIDEINVEDLDETSEGWAIITGDEMTEILDSCKVIAEA